MLCAGNVPLVAAISATTQPTKRSITMAQIVQNIPTRTRATKYNYDELFDGQTRRLVQGEDFTVSPASFRTALYGRKTKLNEQNPKNQIGLTISFREENGQTVAYVQKTEPKVRKSKAEKPAEPVAKAVKKAPAKKTVSPNPKTVETGLPADKA